MDKSGLIAALDAKQATNIINLILKRFLDIMI